MLNILINLLCFCGIIIIGIIAIILVIVLIGVMKGIVTSFTKKDEQNRKNKNS